MTLETKSSVEKNNQEKNDSSTSDLQPGEIEVEIACQNRFFKIRGPKAVVDNILGQLNSQRFPNLFPPSFKF